MSKEVGAWKIITVLNKIRGKERMRIRCGSTDRVLMRFLLGIGIKGYIHLDIAHVLTIN
jgi:hypothetical protein